jgi:ribosomal protein L1
LVENLTALYGSIEQNRPSGVKVSTLKAYLFATMGSSIKLDLEAFA